MNKTQIKRALELKKESKLETLRESYRRYAELQEQIFINNSVGVELATFNIAIKSLETSKPFKDFSVASRALLHKVSNTPHLKALNSHRKQDFFYIAQQITDGTFDFDCYALTNRYSGRPEDKLALEQHEGLIKETSKEFERLLAFLTSTTAVKFMDYMKEIGLIIEVNDDTEKYQLPAPKFNLNLIK